MSYVYTTVSTRTGYDGHSTWGRVSREQAIADAKSYYEDRLAEAHRVLAAIDAGEIDVVVHRGLHVPKVLEKL